MREAKAEMVTVVVAWIECLALISRAADERGVGGGAYWVARFGVWGIEVMVGKRKVALTEILHVEARSNSDGIRGDAEPGSVRDVLH